MTDDYWDPAADGDIDYADRADHYPLGAFWSTTFKEQLEAKVEERISDYMVKKDGAYEISLEPPSAMFVNAALVKVVGLTDPAHPLDNKVVTQVIGEWNDIGEWLLKSLEGQNIPFTKYARSGGAYANFQNKKIKRDLKFGDIILGEALDLYRTAYGQAGLLKLREMIRVYRERCKYNLQSLRQDPNLLLVGKPAGTGTGWEHPWNNREKMAANFSAGVAMFDLYTKMYYDQLVAAVDNWPAMGTVIHIPGGSGYRGITGGARSDADVVSWGSAPSLSTQALAFEAERWLEVPTKMPAHRWGAQQIEAATRQVGNDPSSTFFCPGTTPTAWTMEQWAKFQSEYHIMPNDLEGFIRVMTTVPATMPGDDPEQMVSVNADFGYNEYPSRADGLKLTVVNPGITLGADNIVMRDIYIQTSRHVISLLESGQPFTMLQYLATAGEPVAEWARQAGVAPGEMEIYQVGDDLQIRIKRKYLAAMMAALGPWLKVKGMDFDPTRKQHTVFLLGHYVTWHEETGKITVFVEPRILKTISSAKASGNHHLPSPVEFGKWYRLDASTEAKEAVAITAELHRDHLFFHGTPAEWEAIALGETEDFFATKIKLAKLGLSEYFEDLLGYDSSNRDQRAADAEKPVATVKEGGQSGHPVTVFSGAPSEPIRVAARVVYAMPTCGKSFALEALEQRGYSCTDTDFMLEELTRAEGIEPWSVEGMVWRDEHWSQVVEAVRAKCEAFDGDVIFTNIREFDWDDGFVRTDPSLIRSIMAARGEDHAQFNIEKWCKDVEGGSEQVLGEGEYLMDYLDKVYPPRDSGFEVYYGPEAVRVVDPTTRIVVKIFSPDGIGEQSAKISNLDLAQRRKEWHTTNLADPELARQPIAQTEIIRNRLAALLTQELEFTCPEAYVSPSATRYVLEGLAGEVIILKKAGTDPGDSIALYAKEQWDRTLPWLGDATKEEMPDIQELPALLESIDPTLGIRWTFRPIRRTGEDIPPAAE